MSYENLGSDIKFYNRSTGKIEVEKVYGDSFIKLLYKTSLGKLTGKVFTNKYFSQFYGSFQDFPLSARKVRPFVEKFNINLDEFEPGAKITPDPLDSFENFNQFFIRKFKLGQRQFDSTPSVMPAFAEARYVGFESVNEKDKFPVKGIFLGAQDLIGHQQVGKIFQGGPLLIARLCPVDYHRYHYPDDGKILDQYRVKGAFDSVNPLALKYKNQIFIKNERHVSILQTKNFGRLAYIEVGAICVGKIVQTHRWDKPFIRGEEKGYFLFGGSTVVVIGEKGLWKPADDILKNTQAGMETYLKLGEKVAHS